MVSSNVAALNAELKAQCKVLPFGKKEIRSIAICSGASGYGSLNEVLQVGVDVYLTGDTMEWYHTFQDAHMNIIFLP